MTELSGQSLSHSHRSFDREAFWEAFKDHPEDLGSCTPEDWVGNPNNAMYVKDGSVGLLTFEYPGLYTGHWFFKVRGRAALDLAREFLHEAFTELNMQAVRGLTPVKLLGARWAARQMGFKSLGIIDTPHNGECEIFYLTKEEFYNKGQE